MSPSSSSSSSSLLDYDEFLVLAYLIGSPNELANSVGVRSTSAPGENNARWIGVRGKRVGYGMRRDDGDRNCIPCIVGIGGLNGVPTTLPGSCMNC